MMLNVQKDSAMQKSGRKTFYMWEVAPDKDQGNQVNKWLPSTANLPSMLGTWYTGQPWPHSMLQMWVSSNEPCQPSQEGRTRLYHEAKYALDSGTCPQTGYHQEHQVPGAPPMPLTTSMYLFSGVEIQGTDRVKKQVMTLVSSCPVWVPRPFDHTTLWPKTLSSFASSKVACELHQHLTVKPGGWNSTHNQLGPRDVQACPVFLSFFSNQIYKTKCLQNIRVIVILSRP